jgi:hypothetical protein
MIRITDSARAVLAGLSIFLIGAVAGVVLDRALLTPANSHASVTGAERRVHRDHDEVLADLSARLGLTSEQSARVREIFSEHQAEIDSAWAQVHRNLEGAFDDVTTDIEGMLDADQIQRLHAWLAERHGRIPGHGEGRTH